MPGVNLLPHPPQGFAPAPPRIICLLPKTKNAAEVTIGSESCKNVTLVCQVHKDGNVRSYTVLIVIILAVTHDDDDNDSEHNGEY